MTALRAVGNRSEETRLEHPQGSSSSAPPSPFLLLRPLLLNSFSFSPPVSAPFLPAQVGSFPLLPGVAGSPAFSDPQILPPKRLVQHCFTDKTNLLPPLPWVGWSPVPRRTWSFGRRWKCWRTPTGECGRVRGWLSCLTETPAGGRPTQGQRRKESGGDPVASIVVPGRLYPSAQRHVHVIHTCTHTGDHAHTCSLLFLKHVALMKIPVLTRALTGGIKERLGGG